MFWKFFNQKFEIHVSFGQILIILVLIIGGFIFFENMIFSHRFDKRRQKSHEYMLKATQKLVDDLKNDIEIQLRQVLASEKNSSALGDSLGSSPFTVSKAKLSRKLVPIDSLGVHLRRLAIAVENVAVADRSASLDNIFERYSVLVGLTALLFAIIGIYSGIHFRDYMNQLKADLDEINDQQEKQLRDFQEQIQAKSEEVKGRLDDVVDQSMNMIWMVGNNLEILTNLGVIDPKRASTLLDSIYKTGFRFELHSPNANERLSALHNLYAQGDCEDLPELAKIVRNNDEKRQIRRLAWRAIQKILKRCPHPEGHPELILSNDGLFDDPEQAANA